jgi:hypothetical protein
MSSTWIKHEQNEPFTTTDVQCGLVGAIDSSYSRDQRHRYNKSVDFPKYAFDGPAVSALRRLRKFSKSLAPTNPHWARVVGRGRSPYG